MEIYPDILQLRCQLETDLLSKIPDNEYLLLIFDSIDQLQQDAYDCQWLPKTFPKNIKCIVSTLPDHGGILSNLKSIINYNQLPNENIEHLFIFVPPFDASTVEIIHNDWLHIKQRTLSNEQRLFITQWIKERNAIVPLFMKLVFDILCTWHSYDTIDNQLKTCRTVDDCILYLFNQLQLKHNNVLFRRALSYMTACRSGISQNELEDVLSLDDDVLKSVFEHYIPPIQRLPGILWTRIRNDLDEYITEKEVDDSPVIYWYHRRFIEIVNAQYLSKTDETERTLIFGNMIDLYSEAWTEKNKPLKIDNKKLIDKYHLSESNGEIQANRLITSQPIEFIDDHGQIQYNKRKLNELPEILCKLSPNLAIPIAANEVFFNYSFMHAKTQCSSFDDIAFLMQHFKETSVQQLSKVVLDMKQEIDILLMIYMIVGRLLEEYPNNYVFEFSSRLLNFFGIKPNITHLIKQFDEQSIKHWSLIVPYCQMQPPGSGLVYSMNKHTASVTHLDLTDDQTAAISLSNRIVVIDMTTGRTALDVKLPELNESYLNSTTLPNIFYSNETKYTNIPNKNYQQFHFLVTSLHHMYFVSADDKIKFEKISNIGFMTVEILDLKHALCIITELDVAQLDSFSSQIKYVFCIRSYKMIVVVCQDGMTNFYSIIDLHQTSFTHRGSTQIDQHVNLIAVDESNLIYTYEGSAPTDFIYINLKCIHESKNILSATEIIKKAITFDRPIETKTIKKIILANKTRLNINSTESLHSPLFIAMTTNCLYVIHQCEDHNFSYARIDGYFDIVAMHENSQNTIYTARGGIIDIFVWKCIKTDEDTCSHTYELYASIDISSSPVTGIKPVIGSTLVFLCSLANGAIHIYQTEQLHEAYKAVPSFPRTKNVIGTVQLHDTIAVTLDNERRELAIWSYQHSTSIDSIRLYSDPLMVNEFAIISNKFNSNMIFILIILNNHRIEIYSCELLHHEPVFILQLRSTSRVHSTTYGDFLLLTNTGSLCSIVQQTNSYDNIEFKQKNNVQLNIQCSMMFSTIVNLDSNESLVVFNDNLQSIAIWTRTYLLIYIDITHSEHLLSLNLTNYSNEPTQDSILLHFNDKSLVVCRIKFDEVNKKGSVEMIPLDTADLFCRKNNFVASINTKQNQLNLRHLRSETLYKSIQIENECEQICLNETATYVFVVIKPRILFMYRVNNGQQMAKLFLYDSVISMRVNNDFIVFAMNDRRLLTLMIADPNDPNVQKKIQALPSRNSQRQSQSTTLQLIQHVQKCADMDLNNLDDDDDDDVVEIMRPNYPRRLSVFRFVNHFQESNTNENENKLIESVPNDSLNEVEFSNNTSTTVTQQQIKHDMNDIHQKVVEYDQQQLTGVQLANVGNRNLKIINNYSVTSSTCSLF
ncbi:unnamed protein product [Adineta steineri]|uniref:NWD1/2-like winged helix-turn-helix domain-containing protein n=1 Tax=Adineta steineri TaxID=433720 RepID=A0A814FYJ3_9BILA|nr:unnamed protein product [Adineta steineri]